MNLKKSVIAASLATSVTGTSYIAHEQFKPREYIEYISAKGGNPPLLVYKFTSNKFKQQNVDMSTTSEIEENIFFKTMDIQDSLTDIAAKWLGTLISSLFSSGCSGSPAPTPQPPAPDKPPTGGLQTHDWGISKVLVPQAHQITKGKGIKICIADTGVARHPDLKIAGGINFTGGSQSDYTDRAGHGTHVAGTVSAQDNGFGLLGACPDCEIWVIKVLDDRGSGTLDGIAQGYIWGADNGCAIITASLGATQASQYLYQSTQYAKSKGAILIAAAGNSASSEPNYPAAFDTVLSVSATDRNNQLARFSSYGGIDFAAPGVDIISTLNNGSYGPMSGTSMATPLAAGVLGLALSQGKTLLTDSLGNAHYYGAGIINAKKSVGQN